MNTRLLTTARRLWCVGHADQATQRANMRKWVRSIRHLGDRWLLAHHINRIQA